MAATGHKRKPSKSNVRKIVKKVVKKPVKRKKKLA